MSLENTILAHRYLYYVKSTPVISDYEYDILEKEAIKEIPDLNTISSDLESSYSEEVKNIANKLLNK